MQTLLIYEPLKKEVQTNSHVTNRVHNPVTQALLREKEDGHFPTSNFFLSFDRNLFPPKIINIFRITQVILFLLIFEVPIY